MPDTSTLPTPAEMNALCQGYLPGHFGLEVLSVERGEVRSRLTIRSEFLAPNGFLHAATLVALADSSCGIGTIAALAGSGASFTTLELKTNFLGTARAGEILCTAKAAHIGRTTQLWDAEITEAVTGKRLALFRCTQMVLKA